MIGGAAGLSGSLLLASIVNRAKPLRRRCSGSDSSAPDGCAAEVRFPSSVQEMRSETTHFTAIDYVDCTPVLIIWGTYAQHDESSVQMQLE